MRRIGCLPQYAKLDPKINFCIAFDHWPRVEPIWHLVSESNSVPIQEFGYGAPIPGMHPAVKGIGPEALAPGEKYRIVVETASAKIQHDFVPVAR